MEWGTQQIDIQHQGHSCNKGATMGMSHRTFEVWSVLLAGLPNNAMTVDPTRHDRQRVKNLPSRGPPGGV